MREIFCKKWYVLENILGLISGSLPEDEGGSTCMQRHLKHRKLFSVGAPHNPPPPKGFSLDPQGGLYGPLDQFEPPHTKVWIRPCMLKDFLIK